MEATQIDKHLFQPLGFGAGLAPVFSIVGRLVGCVAGWVAGWLGGWLAGQPQNYMNLLAVDGVPPTYT